MVHKFFFLLKTRFLFKISLDQVIGVAQLCNKINGSSFTKFDEERTTAFAIFVGLSLVQVKS